MILNCTSCTTFGSLLVGKLKDSLPLVGPPDLPVPELFDPYPWIVKELPVKEGGVKELMEAPADISLTVTPIRYKAKDVHSLQAIKFGEFLKAGYKPGEAAHKLKTSVRAIMEKPQAQKIVKDLIETYEFTAEVRKHLVKAAVNKGIIENSAVSEDGKPLGDPKLLIDYLKLAQQDGELGITAPQNVNVNMGLNPILQSLLDKTTPIAELGPPPEIEGETEDLA